MLTLAGLLLALPETAQPQSAKPAPPPTAAAQPEPAKPAPPLTASVAPVVVSGTTRTLADIARERKLGKNGVVGGTLSVAGAPLQHSTAAASLSNADKAAAEAQRQMDRTIKDGAWTQRNIHYHEGIKQQARNEWDNAAENCRKTPGCIPVYRDSAEVDGVKPLRTGDETNRDLKKKLGSSIDVPSPRPKQ